MRLLFAGLFALVISSASPLCAHAAPPTKAQVSMLVAGKISVSPEGRVTGFSLEEADKLPPPVVKLLNQGIPKWRFEPPTRDGKAVALTTSMTLRVVARPIDSKRSTLELGSATFGHNDTSDAIRYKHRERPVYPAAAVRANVTGTVYLVVDINKEGRVQNIAAQQVNLRVKGSPNAMKQFRRMLARASMNAVRKWRFGVPTTGKLATRDHWVARIPINYQIARYGNKPKSGFGRWIAYMPGPKRDIPWLEPDDAASNSADALPSEGIYLVDDGPRLIFKPHG